MDNIKSTKRREMCEVALNKVVFHQILEIASTHHAISKISYHDDKILYWFLITHHKPQAKAKAKDILFWSSSLTLLSNNNISRQLVKLGQYRQFWGCELYSIEWQREWMNRIIESSSIDIIFFIANISNDVSWRYYLVLISSYRSRSRVSQE